MNERRNGESGFRLFFHYALFLFLSSSLNQFVVAAQQPAASPQKNTENFEQKQTQSDSKSSSTGLAGDAEGASETTARYKPLRHEEDWSDMRDESQRTDSLDRLKHIPLGENS